MPTRRVFLGQLISAEQVSGKELSPLLDMWLFGTAKPVLADPDHEFRNDAIDMTFLVAGTDFVPRLRQLRARVPRATPDEVTKIVQRVVKSAVACH